MNFDLPSGGILVVAPWLLFGTIALLLVWVAIAASLLVREVRRLRAHERATERSLADAPSEERASIRKNAARRRDKLRDAVTGWTLGLAIPAAGALAVTQALLGIVFAPEPTKPSEATYAMTAPDVELRGVFLGG